MAQAIIASMTKRLQLVEAQENAGLDGKKMMADQCESVVAEIAGLRGKLTTEEAIEISTALGRLKWGIEDKQKIGKAINECVSAAEMGAKGSATTQYCPCLENYLTDATAKFLEDKEKSMQAKLYAVAHQMCAWHMFTGEEKMHTKAVAIVLALHPEEQSRTNPQDWRN